MIQGRVKHSAFLLKNISIDFSDIFSYTINDLIINKINYYLKQI